MSINLQPFIYHRACQPALDYLSTQENMQEAWDNCTEYENMFWLMLRSNDVTIDQYLEITEKIKTLFDFDADAYTRAYAGARARADADARAYADARARARAYAGARARADADAYTDAYTRACAGAQDPLAGARARADADARAHAYAHAEICSIVRCIVPIVPELN